MLPFIRVSIFDIRHICLWAVGVLDETNVRNHGKTKSATLQKRNVIFKAKTKCTKITEKATHLSGFFHLFKRHLNNIQKEHYIV